MWKSEIKFATDVAVVLDGFVDGSRRYSYIMSLISKGNRSKDEPGEIGSILKADRPECPDGSLGQVVLLRHENDAVKLLYLACAL